MNDDLLMVVELVHAMLAWPWLDQGSRAHVIATLTRLGEALEAATAAGYQGA